MSLQAEDRAACEALAAAPGTAFEALYGFLPASDRDYLLAAEALFRSLREIPLSVSEPSIGAAKLAWWQKELAQAPTQGSQHPVARACLAAGVIERLHDEAFRDYLHALVVALQEDSVTDLAALRLHLRETAGREACMLAGDVAAPTESIVATAGAARLLELSRSLSRPDVAHSWLPMDLVARHRYGRNAGGEAREGLVGDLALTALNWRREFPLALDACNTAGGRYLGLLDRLIARRLARASRRPAAWLAARAAPGFGDVFRAWRTARRLPRGDR